MPRLKKLPIGIQTFRDIREENYVYVDKTDQIANLIENGRYYFFARPRRFGKSLLVSTLQALFEGHKELFEGLAVYKQWDWNTKYPVIKISFGGVARNRKEMKQQVAGILRTNHDYLELSCQHPEEGGVCLRELIEKTSKKYGRKVVILVDEYDKFIVDNLDQPEIAKEGREILRDMYATIKDSDEYIKFTLLTGVSKFSKVSIFSGLNNLEDISLDPRYGSLCGYTHNDLETIFSEHLEGVNLEQVRLWYNGYYFLGEPVYNPFDILLFIKNSYVFDNYWFSTGTPTFLMKLIKQRNYFIPQLDNLTISNTLINSYDIERLELEPLLFQTGYLTIKKSMEARRGGIEYVLGMPNKEVRLSFNDVLLDYLTDQPVQRIAWQNQLYDIFEKADMADLERLLRALFAGIPYNNHTRNNISTYEGYYASVIYAYIASLGLELIPEDVTNKGRIDLTIKMGSYIYLLEFKVGSEGKALEQIKAKGYAEKYIGQGEIYLIGIDFDPEEKSVAGFEWERV